MLNWFLIPKRKNEGISKNKKRSRGKMADISVNEYVRTIDGNIGKIEQINKEPTDDNVIYIVADEWVGMYEEIVKHSSNIIDLIEAGDYVNGIRVDDIIKHYFVMYDNGGDIRIPICTLKKELKSIVTKEQFKSMEYEVGEDD